MISIGIELLVANALINEIEHCKNKYMTIEKAREYARKVSERLDEKGVRHNVLRNNSRLKDCEKDFIVNFDYVVVGDGVTSETLRDKYRGPLSYELLEACMEVEKEMNGEMGDIANNI